MRVAAKDVKPGDRVRGIGLVVEYSEPQSDFVWSLVGDVSTKEDGDYSEFHTSIVLPNDHLVNVCRSDANFRDDRVALVQGALTRFREADGSSDDTTQTLVDELTRVAAMPRGAEADYVLSTRVEHLVMNELEGDENAEGVLEILDSLTA